LDGPDHISGDDYHYGLLCTTVLRDTPHRLIILQFISLLGCAPFISECCLRQRFSSKETHIRAMLKLVR